MKTMQGSSNNNNEGTPLLNTSERSESERAVRFGANVAPCAAERASSSGTNNSSNNNNNSKAHLFQRRLSSSFYQKLTHSDREMAMQKPGVGEAAFLIRDAVLGAVENPAEGAYIPYSQPDEEFRNVVSIVCRRICSMRPFRRLLDFAVWVLVLLSFVEPPSWCRSFDRVKVSTDNNGDDDGFTDNWHCEQVMSRRGPPAEDPESTEISVDYYPNFGAMILTRYQALIIELVCIILVVLYALLRIGRDGMSMQRYFRKGPNRYARIAELIAVFCSIYGMISSLLHSSAHARHWAPFWRITLLMSFNLDCRRELRTLIKLMPEVMNILALLFIVILFYAWIGVVAFYGSEEGKLYFPNLIDAMWTLWIMVTTANYPDVMMPAYNKNRVVTIYFVIFMIITFFFMMNVILASVVNAYDNELEQRKHSRQVVATQNLKKAFQLLSNEGKMRIDRETVMALFLILNQDFPEIRTIPLDDAKLLFAILDKDGSNHISEDEFMEFGNVMLLQFDRASSYATFIERVFPKVFHSPVYQCIADAIKSQKFEYAVDIILVLNAIVICIQSYPQLIGVDVEVDPHVADGEIDTVWEAIETLFTAVYCLEILAKVTVLGWKRFSESLKNMFDMIITVFSVLATAYVYYPNEYSDSRLIRYVVMARVLRLARLLVAMRPFQIVANISVEILPMAKNIFLLLFCIMYVFAALGMKLYGGMISRDPADPLAHLVLDTDFSDNEYWANNFNDMLSGLNVLFNLLVVNNWTECQAGFEAVTEGKYNRLFFLAFHVLGVILVNNLVIAFIVNSFIEQWDKYQENVLREEVEGEAVIEGREAIFDAKYITGTETHLSGLFVAKLGRRAHQRQSQQEMLRNLFTRSESSEDPIRSSFRPEKLSI